MDSIDTIILQNGKIVKGPGYFSILFGVVMSTYNRRAGIILHPVSLPSQDGIGDFGSFSFKFIDFLQAAGMSVWQILPLGPTGYGDSPYTSISSFAGNPLFISLDTLADEGLLDSEQLDARPRFNPDRVEYPRVYEWKVPLIRDAARTFIEGNGADYRDEYRSFCEEEVDWLDDYALFVTAKDYYDVQAREKGAKNSMWNRFWPKKLALRDPAELERCRGQWEQEIEEEKVIQFFFYRQWTAVKNYANERGISLFGDIPIFVSANSSDVWSHPELFQLDKKNQLTAVAGVPPDYFSSTGQRWGNPLYRWEEHRRTDFKWWISRIKRAFELADIVRIDHFRGLEACWEIPAAEPTAIHGAWVKAPGRELLQKLREELGELPVVAEDLGVITPEVEELRKEFRLQGMKVLQFAFETDGHGGLNPDNPFLPHNYRSDYVVYTGTHDNDTSLGWFQQLGPDMKKLVLEYLGAGGDDIVWELIRAAFVSVARTAIVPLQDVLRLNSDARMNTPGTVGTNWNWRVRPEALNGDVSGKLKWFARLYNRLSG